MVKKIIALVMVLGVVGGILAGCSKPDENAAPATTATTGAAAPAATTGG
ncbi:MAG: hypothetical protein QOJ65_1838 [Fimbriimonadaceae bacterium]|jgi:ABC-type molybdate transport system substrate-binding protein|nr:hypothetical protein [Fimbriimonadaceae bacterium]